MQMFRLVALSVLSASAGATGRTRRAPALPRGWTLAPFPAGRRVGFSLSVVQNSAGLEAVRHHALRASDPADALYGAYLSADAVARKCAPSPEALGAVRDWIVGGNCGVTVTNELMTADCSLADAEARLNTSLYLAINSGTGQTTRRALDFTLPEAIESLVAVVYGLHGLPLPPRAAPTTPSPSLSAPSDPVAVTPDILRSTYKVGTHYVGSGNVKNRQAVVEFAGQTMNTTDLVTFFAKYVPSAGPGDATVYKFQGDPGTGRDGLEAALDIQYIMGVAPKILTEFWYQKGNDFCSDVKVWATAILTHPNPPLVHSISYGAQTSLDRVGCANRAAVDDIDNDFAKLAAMGFTVIFASGDSGSGYGPPLPHCNQPTPDTKLEGAVLYSWPSYSALDCCSAAGTVSTVGYSFTPTPTAHCDPTSGTAGIAYTGMTAPQSLDGMPSWACCQQSQVYPGNWVGWSWVEEPSTPGAGNCTLFATITGHVVARGRARSGTKPKAGVCTALSTVSGSVRAPGSSSGHLTPDPTTNPKLWPSWPASSPWVTAVGATRFIDHTVGQPEMASDQFGSGGGFSHDFPVFAHQASATKAYLATAQNLPPAGSFSPLGRGTADVSALGEGYQIVEAGGVMPTGGTSASTPTFAGLISLINEQRLAAFKPALGYLNPWMYANPQMFTDVVVGTNAIGRGTGPIKFGFQCAKGWDPATGLGTPLFDAMLESAMS